MDQEGKNKKRRMNELVIQFAIIIAVAILLQFIFNGKHSEGLARLGFPQSIAIAIILRLSFYPLNVK